VTFAVDHGLGFLGLCQTIDRSLRSILSALIFLMPEITISGMSHLEPWINQHAAALSKWKAVREFTMYEAYEGRLRGFNHTTWNRLLGASLG
jgi:hypothetical protein